MSLIGSVFFARDARYTAFSTRFAITASSFSLSAR